MGDFAHNLAIESWTLYCFGIFLIACRMVSRRLALGSWKNLQVDDYLMLVIAGTFTGVTISVNETAVNGSNYLPPGVAETLTPKEVQMAIWGSKMTFALEEFTLSSIWLVKACLLILYNRLTLGLKEQYAVKIVAVYAALGFIVVQILFLAVWCGPPITMYWDVPVVESQCATYYHHMITTTVFNVSSDIMMICIPLPLVIRAHLPLKRKLVLSCIFSLGIFVILTAILNRYYNFTVAYSPIFLNWYIGEVATAIYVANVPLLWALLKRVFRLDKFAESKQSGTEAGPSSSRNFYSGNKPRPHRLASSTDSIVGYDDNSEERDIGRYHSIDEQLELTPACHRNANHTSIRAAENGYFKVDDRSRDGDDDEGRTIVKTVEISQYRT